MDDFDPFDEDETEHKYLLSKPSCFIVLGKPGCGKSTLAMKFAQAWKCEFLSVEKSISDAIEAASLLGLQAKQSLSTGGVVSNQLALQILLEKLKSPEVQHHGYILDGWPTLSEEYLPISDQIEFLRNLALKPDFIINIKIPDGDLINRRLGVNVDPFTEQSYTRNFYETESARSFQAFIVPNAARPSEEIDDAADAENVDDSDVEDKDFDDDVMEDVVNAEEFDKVEHAQKLHERLVVRADDFDDCIRYSVKLYRERILRPVEDLIADHDQQRVIELDGNCSAKDVLKNLMTRLHVLLLNRVPVPLKLMGGDDAEEIGEDADPEDMLRALAAAKNIAPGFRWRRSRWGRVCPVALSEGNAVLGNPKFAVSFLDKMYILSSSIALDKFLLNPRVYLLPPQPVPPCKVVVLGPPLSGVSTLASKLAVKYNAKVINVAELMKPRISEAKEKLVNQLMAEALSAAITKVKEAEAHRSMARKGSLGAVDEEGDAEVEDEGVKGADTIERVESVVDKDHPEVVKLLAAAMDSASRRQPATTPDMFVDCLESAFKELYEGTYNNHTCGGWVLDSFPSTKEQLSKMVERGIIPDDVFVFRDDTVGSSELVGRWYSARGLAVEEELSSEESENLAKFKDSLLEYDRNWVNLQAYMRNSNNIEPLLLLCSLAEADAFASAVNEIEGQFSYQGWEYSGMDQDEEEEDLVAAAAAEEENEDDAEEDGDANKGKPFGDTLHFCPVMLKDQHVLWPGNPETAVKYRERVYFLSSVKARESFLDNPAMYLPKGKPFQPPALRLLLIGAKGSGKTLHGRMLAKKFKVFHISFQERLQELIMHKTKKRIGPQYEQEEKEEESLKELELGEENEDSGSEHRKKQSDYVLNLENEEEKEQEEAVVEFTELEENIRNNLTEDEPLTRQTLEAVLVPWWREEPFKSNGILLEGFPRTADEARFLAESGLYPDGALLLSIKDSDVVDRLMPSIYEKWKVRRQRRMVVKENKRFEKLKRKEAERKRRKEAKLEELAREKAERRDKHRVAGEEESVAEEEVNEAYIDELVNNEMAEEEEEVEDVVEEEETEADAVERIKFELVEKYELDMAMSDAVQDVLRELMIPVIEVEAGRKPSIVQYAIVKMLKAQVEFRSSLFDRCQPISPQLAKKLLMHGYKQPSRFKRWCPVQLYDGDHLSSCLSLNRTSYPAIYRQHIYFLSTEENRERFMHSPQTFLQQKTPGPLLPLKLAILGPPKSGKTTLCSRFVQEYGLAHLSIGKAVRRLLDSQAHTELVRLIGENLRQGKVLPDELAAKALEVCLLDPICKISGFVLDGYPSTMQQVLALQELSIIPYKVIDLHLPDKVVMQRGAKDRKAPTRVLPLHDSHSILLTRNSAHHRESVSIRVFYNDTHRSLHSLDALKSKWWLFVHAAEEVHVALLDIQTYINRTAQGKAAAIRNMCVTPSEVAARLGCFAEYCPVSLADDGELVDCSADASLDLVVEYRSRYYKMENSTKMAAFLENPDRYVPPNAPRKLPSTENLPKRCASLEAAAPRLPVEFLGYCTVTYVDGSRRYEFLIPGNASLAVEYKKKLHYFATERNLLKFMRNPDKYSGIKPPSKLPPKRDPVDVATLPMLGYMEQTVASALIKAITAAGCLKPKFPFRTARQSALLYIAYHLKAHNPKASAYVREKYKRQIRAFEEHCELIKYLGGVMRKKYLEPEDRPTGFDHKLDSFMSLSEVTS